MLVNELYFHYIWQNILFSSNKSFWAHEATAYNRITCIRYYISTEYLFSRQLPSKTERIYSLSMIWKELEYNFAFHLISKAQIRQPVLRLFA